METQYRNHRQPWTDKEYKFLLDNYNELGPKKTSEKLGRTYYSVVYQAKVLGINYKHKTWTDEEVEEVKILAQSYPAKTVAKMVGVTEQSIRALGHNRNFSFKRLRGTRKK